jgi:hypothetical protein
MAARTPSAALHLPAGVPREVSIRRLPGTAFHSLPLCHGSLRVRRSRVGAVRQRESWARLCLSVLTTASLLRLEKSAQQQSGLRAPRGRHGYQGQEAPAVAAEGSGEKVTDE